MTSTRGQPKWRAVLSADLVSSCTATTSHTATRRPVRYASRPDRESQNEIPGNSVSRLFSMTYRATRSLLRSERHVPVWSPTARNAPVRGQRRRPYSYLQVCAHCARKASSRHRYESISDMSDASNPTPFGISSASQTRTSCAAFSAHHRATQSCARLPATMRLLSWLIAPGRIVRTVCPQT
jgi:hypothetical protein